MATLRVRQRPWWKSSFKVASYADSYNWNKSGSFGVNAERLLHIKAIHTWQIFEIADGQLPILYFAGCDYVSDTVDIT